MLRELRSRAARDIMSCGCPQCERPRMRRRMGDRTGNAAVVQSAGRRHSKTSPASCARTSYRTDDLAGAEP
eukprot:CAMPEP_0179868726 /NCGR_PEP_ID=MMETSP0982-20121206/19043_1 /TAXON_ID=483367 /ORGANISM="non described non described, Strain CCMP 2436" /LENGTH=70 /DNA_ID=CAMNT_0021758543 /DNA_START=239 /DNA_END=451 /DNA_ORIENTATION=+